MIIDKEKITKYYGIISDMGITDKNFPITDHLVCVVFFKYIFPSTKIMHFSRTMNQFERYVTKQLNFTRLSLLNLKYHLNGEKCKGIKEGFVYAATNPAFNKYTKIGSTVNVNDRIKNYQTYCPNRDFVINSYFFSYDRFLDEGRMLMRLNADHEWAAIDFKNIEPIFIEKRNRSRRIDFSKYINIDDVINNMDG